MQQSSVVNRNLAEIFKKNTSVKSFNHIQDGGGGGEGGQKGPLTSFSPVTSRNVGISSQNFMTFSFNPFATLV